MRVLGITETCDLGSLYLRLLRDGHDVKVTVSEPLAQGTMAGLVPRANNWRDELDWLRAAGKDGIIVFEAVGFGELQDALRTDGFNVIGGSAFGDRLEKDRAFAFSLLAKHGIKIAPVREFAAGTDAIGDLAVNPRRCVLKLCDSAGETFVGTLADGSDDLWSGQHTTTAPNRAAEVFASFLRHLSYLEVEPATEIVKRFSTGARSCGWPVSAV